jgi:hypothetical protein
VPRCYALAGRRRPAAAREPRAAAAGARPPAGAVAAGRMSMLAVAALMLCASAPPAIAPGGSEGFFVSPTGSDSNSGTSSASPFKTPFAAQQAVRAALRGHPKPSHISVTLAAGIYHLERPLNLTLADSSPGTTITYKAAASAGRGGSGGSVAPVTLSGGAPVTFVKADAAGLWKADVSALPSQAVAYGRQFYVNDRRAQRSREPGSYQCEKTATSPCARQKTLWGDAAWRITNTSVHIVGPLAAARARSWPNGGAGVELVWSGVGNAAWAESRCPVEAVTSGVASPAADDGAVQVKVSPMCLSCWANFKSQWEHHKIAPPTAIEAIGKDLLQPGQWWLDHEQKQIWYKPLPGETISSTTAMLPVLQKLLSGSGSGAAKISDITFSGISFQYATWHAEEGFVENQSGQGACAGFFGPVTPDTLDQRLPANVEFFRAERITFDRCEFAHLGANALDFAHGAHGNVVQDCLFRDVSAAAVQIGRTDGATAALQDASQQDIGNVVRNSIVRSPAVEFHGSVGLSVGYTIGTNLSHNEISNCTYGPISVGWGACK